MENNKVNAFMTIEGAEVVGFIQSIKDYSKFSFIEENRPVDHAEELAESMKIENLFSPIYVNENLEILDGQNRFCARKILGLPIEFIVIKGYGIKQVQRYNQGTKDWSHDNFLEYYIKRKNVNYIKFKEIKSKYNINFSDLIYIIDNLSDNLIGEKAMFKNFDEGNFYFDNYEEVIGFLQELSLFDKYEYCRQQNFVRAFFKLYTSEFYDKNYIRHRIDICEYKLKKSKMSTRCQYGEFLCESLYNSNQINFRLVYNKELDDFFELNINKKGRRRKK